VKLKQLKMRAFRSFQDETIIDFPENGLVLISGNDPDTGESSGTGKTNILVAIAIAIGLRPVTTEQCQNWKTEIPWQIELAVDTDIGEVVFRRGKKNSLTIGGRTITGSKPISEAIESLFGVPLEIVQALTYRAQGEGSFLLSKTDSEKKDFLSEILDLSKFERALDLSDEAIDGLKSKIQKFETEIEVLRGQITVLEKQRPESQYIDILPIETEILHKTSNIQSLQEAKAALEHDIAVQELQFQKKLKEFEETKTKEIKEKTPSVSDSDSSELQSLNAQKKLLESSNRELLKRATENKQKFILEKTQIETKLKQLKPRLADYTSIVQQIRIEQEKLESIKHGKCHTCNQAWVSGDLKSQESKLKAAEQKAEQLAIFSVESKQLEQQLSELSLDSSSESDIKKNTTALAEIDAEISRVHSEMSAKMSAALGEFDRAHRGLLAEKQALLDNRELSAQKETLRQIDSDIRILKASISALSDKKAFAEKANLELKNRIADFERKMDELEKSKNSKLVALACEESALRTEEKFQEIIGNRGFLGKIFDEILSDISSRANSYMSKLINVSKCTIHFSSEISGKTKTKKSITPMISIDGFETVLTSAAVSGGMMTSIGQAIDFATREVIAARSKTSLQWLCLDEIFNGQGSVTKDFAIEMLKELAKNSLILVIDHSIEFQSRFDSRIDVINKNGVSSIL